MEDRLFLILRRLRIFWNMLFKLFWVPQCPLILSKKSEKALELILRKTNNTEFKGPFPCGTNLKWSYVNYFVSCTFLWNPTAIFNFHRRIMNTGSWLLVEEQLFEDVFQYRCSWEFHNICRKALVLGSFLKSHRPWGL